MRFHAAALTGIRALAAYLVYIHHFIGANVENPGFLGRVLGEGHVGVTVFYVLSGFLIAWRYEEQLKSGALGLGTYFRNRFAKIIPLYWLLLTITLLGFYPPVDGGHILAQYTLFKGFIPSLLFSGIPQSWSLTVEETFYALAPLIFLGRLRLPLVLGASYALALALGYGLLGAPFFAAYYTFFGRCFEFLCGIQLARWMGPPGSDGWASVPGGVRTWGGLGAMMASLVALGALRGGEYSLGVFHPLGLAINNLAFPLGCTLFLAGLLTERTAPRRLLETPLAVALGKSSYAFYLCHMGFIPQLLARGGVAHGLEFVPLILISYGLYRGFEEPMARFIRRAGASS